MGRDRPRFLTFSTDLAVLAPGRVIERRDDHLVIRSPGNPTHWWGTFLLFDAPPVAGDGARWEAAFADALPGLAHRTFA